ncbi:MAG: hypothetical protein V7K40_09345 [Nostoc sp.]|uniref:hypothetical protein n=1 Tax=Nostoc sp. TaxID=1180 RepID=UPI002FF56F05
MSNPDELMKVRSTELTDEKLAQGIPLTVQRLEEIDNKVLAEFEPDYVEENPDEILPLPSDTVE